MRFLWLSVTNPMATDNPSHTTTACSKPCICRAGMYNDVTPLQYRTFKFGSCEAAEGSEEVQHPDQIAAGKISLTWWNAKETSKTRGSELKFSSSGLGTSEEQKKLPEGKKWFMAPGLQTEGGDIRKSSGGFSRTRYAEVRKEWCLYICILCTAFRVAYDYIGHWNLIVQSSTVDPVNAREAEYQFPFRLHASIANFSLYMPCSPWDESAGGGGEPALPRIAVSRHNLDSGVIPHGQCL